MILMARASSGSWLDTRALTANPMKTFCWFMIGVSIATTVNFQQFKNKGYDPRTYHLHLRVSQNEETHAILRNVKQGLSVRKMSAWDANPQ